MRDRRVLVRPALREMVGQVAETRLTLIVAPSGSGKSTLLDCWRRELASAGTECPWLQVSPIHDDPALFLGDLFEAIPSDSRPPAAAQLIREIPHVDRDDTHALARRLGRALKGRSQRLLVFLDDTHRLTRDGPTDRLLDLLLREGPPQLRFAMASRGARPRAAARLVAAGEALVISAEELSLRSHQVATVLEECGIEAAKLVPPLLAETRGWATGVQLAARALARIDVDQQGAFIRTLARQSDLFDYVAGELMANEPREILHVLELVAVLGPVSETTLLAASTEKLQASTLADALDRGMLVREGERIGLPPLWEEYLLRGLRHRSPSDAWRALHARCARQVARTDPERALQCCREGHAWDLLSSLLDEHGREWLDRGRYHFVEEWLEHLTDAGFELSPKQNHLSALTTARRDPAGAIERLEETAARLRSAGDRVGEAGALLDAGIIAANENRPEAMPRMIRRMFSIRRLATDADTRAFSLGAVSIVLMSRNRHRIAWRLLRRIRRDNLSLYPRAAIVANLALMGRYMDWDETLQVLDEVRTDPAHRAHAPSFFLFQTTRAVLRGLRGLDPERCLAEAEEAAEAFRDFRLTMSELAALEAQAKLQAHLGRHADAAASFERAAALAEQLGHAEYEAGLRGLFARELLAMGRHDAASVQARRGVEVFEGNAEARDPVTLGFTGLVGFEALAECGDAVEAHRRAQRQERRFRCPELPIGLHQTKLLSARIAHLAGDEAEARRLLDQARATVKEHGLRDLGPDLGPGILAWAEEMAHGISAKWDLRTLGGLQVSRDGHAIPEGAWRGSTTRRLLLRLLAAPGPERRERIETDLWPDVDSKRARNNLRVALSRLRKALGEDSIVAEGERVDLSAGLRSGWDVARLETALSEPGDSRLAAELLGGPFAPELYDDWADDLRRDIETRLVASGCQRARGWLESGDYKAATRLTSRLAQLAPLGEEVWALCARAELAAGNRTAARGTIARARSLLLRELGAEPGPELLELEREIDRGPPPPSPR